MPNTARQENSRFGSWLAERHHSSWLLSGVSLASISCVWLSCLESKFNFESTILLLFHVQRHHLPLLLWLLTPKFTTVDRRKQCATVSGFAKSFSQTIKCLISRIRCKLQAALPCRTTLRPHLIHLGKHMKQAINFVTTVLCECSFHFPVHVLWTWPVARTRTCFSVSAWITSVVNAGKTTREDASVHVLFWCQCLLAMVCQGFHCRF